MSSTNLTDGRSKLCFSIVNCERNHLRPGEKPGDATRASKDDAEKLSISLGVSIKRGIEEIIHKEKIQKKWIIK